MAATSFSLYVLYSQLCIFWSSLPQPFNNWLQAHVDQGFAWRPGSVSFRTLDEEGAHNVELVVAKQATEVSKDAIRVIEVPFDVPTDGEIEIASISESVPISLAAGGYTLRCEFFEKLADGVLPVRLVFTLSSSRDFKVIRADEMLIVPSSLVMDATPAV
jgi:hypothetical protein